MCATGCSDDLELLARRHSYSAISSPRMAAGGLRSPNGSGMHGTLSPSARGPSGGGGTGSMGGDADGDAALRRLPTSRTLAMHGAARGGAAAEGGLQSQTHVALQQLLGEHGSGRPNRCDNPRLL